MAVQLKAAHRCMSSMKECCVDFDCANDFVEWLVKKEFEIMFVCVHKNEIGNMAALIPGTTKCKEFRFDYNNYCTLVKMGNR